MTGPLHQLASEIAEAHRLQLHPSLEALARWKKLADAAAAAARAEWLSEPAFRLRTGASAKWCRAHFGRYELDGLARRDADRGRRVWNTSCRPPAKRPTTPEERKQFIVASYGRKAS